MTFNSSGPISLGGTTAGQSIEIENGGAGTTTISLNDAAVRTLAGVPSGAITMPTNFYGKSNAVSISYTFTTSTVNAALNVTSISGYSAGKSTITVTVNSGVYLWSNATATPGLTLTGGTTGDIVKLVNNGYIMGQGGQGGNAIYHGNGGGSAGVALSIGYNISLTNNAYIGGGGGGAGSSPRSLGSCGTSGGGGGAGGGAGGSAGNAGGNGGAIGASGTNGTGCYPTGAGYGGGSGGGGGGSYCNCSTGFGGGGGGRIFPGTGGAGGIGGGGGGGSSNAVGGNGIYCSAGGGGGWGASGGNGNTGGLGGAGGKAISLNGYTVTYITTGNVWGAVA